MKCGVCFGSGSLLGIKPLPWWECPACGGAGARFTSIVPPTIRMHRLETTKYAKQLAKRVAKP